MGDAWVDCANLTKCTNSKLNEERNKETSTTILPQTLMESPLILDCPFDVINIASSDIIPQKTE